MSKKELASYSTLTVTVLHAKNQKSRDLLSETDFFVTLQLPTASARTHRTKTVPNCLCPEWNETFHFRVQNNVKNILEFCVYDKDILLNEVCYKVLFDVKNLSYGKKEKKCFAQDQDELWVEFELMESKEVPREYFSNGVLVASPISYLEINVKKMLHATENLILRLTGAYQEEKVLEGSGLSSTIANQLGFYINRELESELHVHLSPETTVTHSDQTDGETKEASWLTSVPLQPQAAKNEVKVSLPIGKGMVDLHLKTRDSQEKDLEVRLDFDIPETEKMFMEKRKAVVGQALQRVLGLPSHLQSHKVPVVAVTASGGGSRAMTALYGSLKGLQELGLLDTVSYIAGVSGSTWTMSSLYGDADWSQHDLEQHISAVEAEISKSFSELLSSTQRQYYTEELTQREKEGFSVSYIDMWGLAIEYLIHGKRNDSTLSSQQSAIAKGQNPCPIYTAVNMKEGITSEAEWCEFTPYEVGFPKYGAFVRSEDFGSEFYLGRLIKKLPETRVSYLLGLWSSIFSCNVSEIWSAITGSETKTDPEEDKSEDQLDFPERSILDTTVFSPVSRVTDMLTSLLTGRPVIGQTYNFLRGFSMHWNYSKNKAFKAWKDNHPDAFPNNLTPSDCKLRLVDSGFDNNQGFPPLLRAHRGVDVILSFNYSWDADQFRVLKQTQEYCSEHQLSFPHIDFSKLEGQPLKEIYIFEDDKNTEAPIVLHFPLVNVSFRMFQAPGLRREGEKEIKAGDIDVTSRRSPYVTKNITYSKADFRSLVELTSYNVVNNTDTIHQALRQAVSRKSKQGPVSR